MNDDATKKETKKRDKEIRNMPLLIIIQGSRELTSVHTYKEHHHITAINFNGFCSQPQVRNSIPQV